MTRRWFACGVLGLMAMTIRPAAAQWDTSGNGLLKSGTTYYFREVAWLVGDQSGTLGDAVSIYGNIVFDGNGNYTLNNAQICEYESGCNTLATVGAYTGVTGTYAIGANGYGFITNLVLSGDYIYGNVSAQGVFIGSSTENTTGYNDLFIAAPLASPLPTSFQGTYAMTDIDFPGAGLQGQGVAYTRSSSFQIQPNAGNLGASSATGYIAGNGTTSTSQSISSASYFFSGGAAVINFSGAYSYSATSLLNDKRYLYFSPDGNFVFGGSPNGWDMMVGVRTSGGTAPAFNSLYYQAGVDQDDSTLGAGYAATNSRYGSVIAVSGTETEYGHRRILSLFNNNPYDYTHGDAYTANSDGTYDDPYDHYWFSSDGNYGVGIGTGSLLGINLLLKAPSFSGQGVYIYPDGILNVGSNAPFTARFAPGELVSIYGTNLASTTAVNYSLPATLGNVQVMVNGNPAPILFVSSGQINAVIPLTTTGPIASVQVINNGTPSNIVTNFVGLTQPGVFGVYGYDGYPYLPAVQHSDYSLVTPANPVQPGETLFVYLTGLGDIDSSGTALQTITSYIDGVQGTVIYDGTQLTTIGGAYQLNVTLPTTGISTGQNVFLDVSGPDAYNSEVQIPIATGAAADSPATAQKVRRPAITRSTPRIAVRSLRRP